MITAMSGIMIVVLSKSTALLQVKSWVKELRRMLGNEVVLCIVGNKTDLEKDRHVTAEEAER